MSDTLDLSEAAESVAPKPVATLKPLPVKPVAAKPVMAKPVAGKPAATLRAKPVAGKPIAANPGVAKPLAGKPIAAKPGAIKPKTVGGKPVAGKPAAGKAPAKPKTVAGKPVAGKAAPKKPASVAAADGGLGAAPVAVGKPSCIWGTILLVFTLLLTIMASLIIYLGITDKGMMAGLRQPVLNISASLSTVPLGPESKAANAATVKTALDAAQAADDAGKAQAGALQTLIASAPGESPAEDTTEEAAALEEDLL